MNWFTSNTWVNEKYEKTRWHRWFAWYPVTVKEFDPEGVAIRCWLETVWRCGKVRAFRGGYFWEYKYSLQKPNHKKSIKQKT